MRACYAYGMKRLLIIVATVVVLGVAYYGLSPLFRNTRVDEEVPQAASMSTGSEATTAMDEDDVAVIVGTPLHPASGTARIVSDGSKQYLRYENFETINGPDLYVYLATDLAASEFIDLGRLKATEGNVNYEIPPGVDLRDYPYALVWCKAFGVLFNSAKLD